MKLLGGTELEQVEHIKYLCVFIDEALSWKTHKPSLQKVAQSIGLKKNSTIYEWKNIMSRLHPGLLSYSICYIKLENSKQSPYLLMNETVFFSILHRCIAIVNL